MITIYNKINKALAESKSAFIIHLDTFKKNILSLQSAFRDHYSKTFIGYSYKTNWSPPFCKTADELGCFAEVVSEMEVSMALKHITDKSKIIYNGPIKTESSIIDVLSRGGIVNVDNTSELKLILKLSEHLTLKNSWKIAFRLNLSYQGQNSRFGQDEKIVKEMLELVQGNAKIKVIGFHIHLPFRSLDSFHFRIISLLEFCDDYGWENIDYLNIGGGFFGNVSKELRKSLGVENSPSFSDYGLAVARTLENHLDEKNIKNRPDLFLEPGSSVVADAMSFVSKIYLLKEIGNRNYAVTFAGRHLLSPTNKTIELPCRILRSTETSSADKINYIISGYTCIEGDILSEIQTERLSVDDLIQFSNVGSYSVVMGSNFILPEPPIYIEIGGKLSLLRKPVIFDEIISRFRSYQ
tara:strand:+ start:3124 stop:4353 length:1230 start_codon:yes stop_codon:yes gene_type:complete